MTRTRRRPLVLLGAAVLLLVAMVVSTKFVTPEEAEALRPQQFEAPVYVQENFPQVVETLTAEATDLATVAEAVDADPQAGGEQFGVAVGSGKFAVPVSFTGTVTSVDDRFMEVDVEGVPDGDTVRIPIGNAVSGTPVRDATGFMTFGDFPGQTDFQNVANELKLVIADEVVGAADPASLEGQEVSVVGAFATGGPEGSYLVQPVVLQATS
ncbi:DUF2291 family protein [Phycicoccus sp. BSK3Z-2]|uniref:DUF2291 family protein n=1 Tax=Phycicoccus avicenniae TaxID=2828860 RepID=A0A941DBG8_9MICO|nr:DUF2291 family protein [Phycicoccus avicenniae]MBR7744618.1 DUF2291 family protein [Phycicoccus avicenniae]